MRRLGLVFLIGVLVTAGCRSQHAQSKRAAVDRWNAARATLNLQLAQKQYEAGEYHKALHTVQGVLVEKTDYLPGQYLKGKICLGLNEPVQARDCFRHCLSLDPNHTQSHYQLGILYEQWNDSESAYTHYESAWRLRPERGAYLSAMAETRLSQNRCAEADQLLRQHVDPLNMDVPLYVTWANIHLCRGDTEAAVEKFRKAHHMKPQDDRISESLAMSLHQMGRISEAQTLLEKLIQNAEKESRPVAAAWHLALGDCYLEKKNYHQARRCFERFNRRESNNPTGWTRLAQVALAQNQLAEAIQYARKALALEPKNVDAFMVLGYAAWKQKNYPQARTHLQRVVQDDPKNGLAYCLLGQVLEAEGDYDQAAACYGEAVRINPKDSLAQKLLSQALKMHSARLKNTESY